MCGLKLLQVGNINRWEKIFEVEYLKILQPWFAMIPVYHLPPDYFFTDQINQEVDDFALILSPLTLLAFLLFVSLHDFCSVWKVSGS